MDRYSNEGKGRRSGLVLEPLLAYWLYWFVLPGGPEDGLNSYVFPLVILLTKERKVALVPIYLEPLYALGRMCCERDMVVGEL